MRMGRLDQALADWNMAVELDPGNADYRWCRGKVWADKGEHDKAGDDFTEAIRLKPNDAIYRVFRGNSRSSQGMPLARHRRF